MDEISEGDSEVQIFSYKIKSHRDVIYSIRNMVNNIVITLYATHGSWTYHSDHFIMYANVTSLCSTHETNITLYVNYISINQSIKYLLSIYYEPDTRVLMGPGVGGGQ